MTLRDPFPIEKFENDNTFGNKLGREKKYSCFYGTFVGTNNK